MVVGATVGGVVVDGVVVVTGAAGTVVGVGATVVTVGSSAPTNLDETGAGVALAASSVPVDCAAVAGTSVVVVAVTTSAVGGRVRSTVAASGMNADEAAASVGVESKIEVFTSAAAAPAPSTPTRLNVVASVVFMISPVGGSGSLPCRATDGTERLPALGTTTSKGHPRSGRRCPDRSDSRPIRGKR